MARAGVGSSFRKLEKQVNKQATEETCRDCNKQTTDWIYDGVIIINEQEEQAYVCTPCRDKRTYSYCEIRVKPSRIGVIYDAD